MNKHKIHQDYRTEWETPKWIFKELDYRRVRYKWKKPVFDFAASAENALAARYWTIEDDSLSKSADDIREALQGLVGPVWLNPPYGRGQMKLWVEFIGRVTEAITSPEMKITELAVLVPASTDTKWFEEMWWRAQHVWFLTPRLRFRHPEKKGINPPHGSCIFFFSKHIRTGMNTPKCNLIRMRKRAWLARDEKYFTKIVKSLDSEG